MEGLPRFEGIQDRRYRDCTFKKVNIVSKPRLTLHIGAGKTGSSAIQTFLRKNATVLAERGIVVPDKNLGFGGTLTGEHVWALQQFISSGDNASVLRALAAMNCRETQGKRILLSAENLSNVGSHRTFLGLDEHFDADAILYIRRQDDLLMSAWQQWYAKGERDLHAWLVRALRRYGQWERIITEWETVVGAGRVKVRLFERSFFVDGDLLSDFISASDIPVKGEPLDTEVGVVNASLSDIVTSIVAGSANLFSSAHDNEYYNYVQRVMGSDAQSGSRKLSLITPEVRESIVDYYRDINARVQQRFFPDRRTLFSPIDHSKYEYLSREDLTLKQIQFLNQLIYRSSMPRKRG